MSFKVLAIGDPHFREDNIPEMTSFTDQVVSLVRKTQPDLVVNLGDSLHTHERSNVFAARACYYFHQKLHQTGVPVAIIVGNHDLADNQEFLSDRHHLLPYREWDRFLVADRVRVASYRGFQFTFVPYVYPGRFQEALDTVEGSLQSRAIFAHQEFRGVRYGGTRSKEGDPWSLDYPLVISGHIHDYQECQSNLIYPGTPVCHTFGTESRKTLSLFTFTSKDFQHRRIALDLVPKVKIELNAQEALDWTPPKGKEIKLVITDHLESIQNLKKTNKYQELSKGVKKLLLNPIRPSGNNTFSQGSSFNYTFLGRLKKSITDPDERRILRKLFQIRTVFLK